jgi:hypothetical protein
MAKIEQTSWEKKKKKKTTQMPLKTRDLDVFLLVLVVVVVRLVVDLVLGRRGMAAEQLQGLKLRRHPADKHIARGGRSDTGVISAADQKQSKSKANITKAKAKAKTKQNKTIQ